MIKGQELLECYIKLYECDGYTLQEYIQTLIDFTMTVEFQRDFTVEERILLRQYIQRLIESK